MKKPTGVDTLNSLGLLVVALALASCAAPGKKAPPGPAANSFRVVLAGEPAALERLERVARDCRLTGIERKKGPDKWLSFDTPARAPRPGDPFKCFIDWTMAHPETRYVFVGDAPPE